MEEATAWHFRPIYIAGGVGGISGGPTTSKDIVSRRLWLCAVQHVFSSANLQLKCLIWAKKGPSCVQAPTADINWPIPLSQKFLPTESAVKHQQETYLILEPQIWLFSNKLCPRNGHSRTETMRQWMHGCPCKQSLPLCSRTWLQTKSWGPQHHTILEYDIDWRFFIM